jgi:streptogramin lyase
VTSCGSGFRWPLCAGSLAGALAVAVTAPAPARAVATSVTAAVTTALARTVTSVNQPTTVRESHATVASSRASVASSLATIAAGQASASVSHAKTTVGAIAAASGSVSISSYQGIENPGTIMAGPNGALWFINSGGDSIGEVTTKGSLVKVFADRGIKERAQSRSGRTALCGSPTADRADRAGRLER